VADSGNQAPAPPRRQPLAPRRPPTDEHAVRLRPRALLLERSSWRSSSSRWAAMFALYEGRPQARATPSRSRARSGRSASLGFALLAEGYSFRTAVKSRPGKVKGDATYWQFIRRARRHRSCRSCILEDLGATGRPAPRDGRRHGLAVVTGDGRWDGYASHRHRRPARGIIAAILVIEMKSLLIGERRQPPRNVEAVHAAIAIDPDVIRVIHLRTQHLGPVGAPRSAPRSSSSTPSRWWRSPAPSNRLERQRAHRGPLGPADRVHRARRARRPIGRSVGLRRRAHRPHRRRRSRTTARSPEPCRSSTPTTTSGPSDRAPGLSATRTGFPVRTGW
jgi:hypothetical protein